MAIHPSARQWRMPGWPHDYLVLRAVNGKPEDHSRHIPDIFVISRLDDWLTFSPSAMFEMYEALGGYAPIGLSVLDREHYDRRLKDRLRAAFRSGELVALTLQRPLPTEAQRHSSPAPAKAPPLQETAWVGIELLDKDKKPVPGVRYRLTLANGAVHEGTLDAQGQARVGGVKPGSCKLSFPDLDARSWS